MSDRLSVGCDIGPAVPILAIERFAAHVLPPLHPALTDAVEPIFRHLCSKNVGDYSLSRKGWAVLLNADPQDTTPKSTEIRAFKCLVAVAAAIERAVATVVHSPPAQTMQFKNTPDTAPVSNWRGHNHRPAGYFLLCDRPEHDPGVAESHWMFVGPTGEYGSERLVGDTASKTVWNMHQTLRDDPQRRFAFTFSVKQTEMQLWFANRGEVLVSEKFDFMSKPQHLIYFFLAFLYTTPEAAGWDPTLTYIPGSDPLQYRVTVNDAAGNRHVYKTVGIESSVGAGVFCGRGTRVWRAVRCDPKTFRVSKRATEVALKDCWVDQSRELEGDVIKKLDELAAGRIASLKKQLDDLRNASTTPQANVQVLEQELGAAEALKASLLIPVIHGVVTLPGSNVKDSTLNRDTILKDEIGNCVFWEHITQEQVIIAGDGPLDELQDQHSGEHRSTYEYLARHREPIMYDSKYHYRLVYGEVCTSLYQVKCLRSILLHLSNVIRALRGLHEAGWVHRDISAGNILVTRLGVAKLADWEYAKRYVGDHAAVTQDIRIGTIDFMAVEVDRNRYLFIPPYVANKGPGVPWSYNPLHDVESVLWLIKFFIENKDIVFQSRDGVLDSRSLAALGIKQDASEDARRQRLAAQHSRVRELFHGTSLRWTEILLHRANIHIQPFHPALIDKGLHLGIEELRLLLVCTYSAVEQGFFDDPPKRFTLDADVYNTFRSGLDQMAASIKSIPAQVHVVSLADSIAKIEGADPPVPVTQPNYARGQTSSVSSINSVGADPTHPCVEDETTAITAKLQTITLDPSAMSPLRPTSPKESHSQSSTAASRPPSGAASRAPSRARSRPPSRSKTKQGTSQSTSSGPSSKGKGKARTTSPVPPVPSSSRLRPPATQGSAVASKSNAGRPP